jgi:hypothetical protein
VAPAVLAVLGATACGAQPATETPDNAPETRYLGNDGYPVPDSPFTREGAVITASCLLGGRGAAVSVQAWDSTAWTVSAERVFDISGVAFGNPSDAEPVHSPLADLCGRRPWNPSPYGVDSLENKAARIRALFDIGYTRMAVVLRDPGTEATHAGFLEEAGAPVRLSSAAADDEQNAVLSPDGRSVWFTYTAASGEHRIGSRSTEGDHLLSDEGPAAGHDRPLVVSGKPALGIQADVVRVSPEGNRFTAKAANVFGTVFDAPDSSGALTGESARNATLVRDCVGVVGWVDDSHVLCRTASGSFQRMDARSGSPSGEAVTAVDPADGRTAEGMVVSADGKKFIASVHHPNDTGSDELTGLGPDFRVVSTTATGESTGILADVLWPDTIFLEWR